MLYPDADLFARVPNTWQPEQDVFTKYWLPLLAGRDNLPEYEQLQAQIVMQMFDPRILTYGPHFVEMQTFLTAVQDLIILKQNEFSGDPQGYDRWGRVFNESLHSSYTNNFFNEGFPTEPDDALLRQLPVGSTEWYPRAYQWTTTGPRLTITKDFFPKEVGLLLGGQQFLMLVPVGLILLQYMYLHALAVSPKMNVRGLRVLASHQRFCDRWGLPGLVWANTDRLAV